MLIPILSPSALAISLAASALLAAPAEQKKTKPSPATLIQIEATDDNAQGMVEGLRLGFLVRGKQLVGIKRDGLQVTSVSDPKGAIPLSVVPSFFADMSEERRAKWGKRAQPQPIWKLGRGRVFAQDGSFGVFSVDMALGNRKWVGATKDFTMDGTITLLSASGHKILKRENLKPGDSFKEGGMEFSIAKEEQKIAVRIKGIFTHEGTVLRSASAQGAKLRREYVDLSSGTETHMFQGADAPITLEFVVLQDLQEIVVPFHCGLKK